MTKDQVNAKIIGVVMLLYAGLSGAQQSVTPAPEAPAGAAPAAPGPVKTSPFIGKWVGRWDRPTPGLRQTFNMGGLELLIEGKEHATGGSVLASGEPSFTLDRVPIENLHVDEKNDTVSYDVRIRFGGKWETKAKIRPDGTLVGEGWYQGRKIFINLKKVE